MEKFTSGDGKVTSVLTSGDTVAKEPPASGEKTRRRAGRRGDTKNMVKRGGVWYFTKLVKGERISVSLETGLEHVAQARRDARLARLTLDPVAFLRENRGRAESVGEVRTLGDVERCYVERWRMPNNDETRRENFEALARVAAEAMGLARLGRDAPMAARAQERAAWRAIRVSELGSGLVKRFVQGREAAAAGDSCALTQANYTARRVLARARAVWTHLEAFGWAELPANVRAFCKTRVQALAHDVRFVPFSEAEGRAFLEGMAALRTENPRGYLGLLLMSRCGLRNGEAVAAQWEWLEEREVVRGGVRARQWFLKVRVYPYFRPKYTLRDVPVAGDVVAELEALAGVSRGARAGEQWLCSWGMAAAERERFGDFGLNKLMRAMVPGRTSYDLRKLAGSIVAERDGIWAAQVFCGHKGIGTTQRYYVSPLEAGRGVEGLPWEG